MKLTIKQLSFVLIGIIIFTLTFASTSQAQISGKHAIKKIKKHLATAEIEIPDYVMREFEDIHYKSAELTALEREQYELHMHVPKPLPENVFSEDFLAEYSERADAYYASDYYKTNKKQKDELLDQSLRLLEPYLEDPNPLPPPSAQATRQEIYEYQLNVYRQLYRMPEHAIEQVEAVSKEHSKLQSQFIKIRHKRDSPEFENSFTKIKELSRERNKIMWPYKRQLLRRQQAIQSIRRDLTPRR